MKHYVSLALLFTLLAALTLALLPPIANEPHYLFHRKDDRTASAQLSYAPLVMTELALINTASRKAEAPPEDGKYLRLPDQPNARAIRLRLLPAAPGKARPFTTYGVDLVRDPAPDLGDLRAGRSGKAQEEGAVSCCLGVRGFAFRTKGGDYEKPRAE
jgi:hypothetical protein